MITVKQILEKYDIVTDKANSKELYLADLASLGIIEESKIPMIRRSLNKNINEMTNAEKKALVSLLENMMVNVIVEKNGKSMSYPSEKDMPTVIILKRKAIRVFPDNQKIGLYYSQALDRYVSIPFGPNAKDLSPQLNEAKEQKKNIDKLSGQSLANSWERLSPEEKPSVASILSPTQRSQVKGGNMAALKGAAKSGAPIGDVAGVAIGLGIRTAIDKIRGVRSIEPEPVNLRKTIKRKIKVKNNQQPKISTDNPPQTLTGVTPFLKGASVQPSIHESFKNKLQIIREEQGTSRDFLNRALGGQGEKVSPAEREEMSRAAFRSSQRRLRHDLRPPSGTEDTIANTARKAQADWNAEYEKSGNTTSGKVGDLAAIPLSVAAGARGVSNIIRQFVKSNPSKASKTGDVLTKYRQRKIRNKKSKAAAAAAGAVAGKTVSDFLGGIGSSSNEPLLKPTDQNRPDFGASLAVNKINTPRSVTGAESGMDVSTIEYQRKRFSGPSGAYSSPTAGRMYAQQANESSNLNIFKQIIESDSSSQAIQIGEETITINKSIAKKIINLHESLNKENKKKLENMLNEDVISFRKVLNFALKQ